MTDEGDDKPGAAPNDPGAGPSGEKDGAQGNVVHLDFKKREEGGGPGPSGPEKLAAFADLVARGKTMVTLDARRPGVRIPPRFKDEMQLNLDFSHRFAGVYDFVYDDRGVRSTLTFGGQPFFCDVPWSAVWAMRSHVDNQMLFWPEDLPEEMLAMFPDAQLILKAKQEEQAHRKEQEALDRRPRGVPSAPGDADDADDADEADDADDASVDAGPDDAALDDRGPDEGRPDEASPEGRGPDDEGGPGKRRGGLRLVKG